MIRPMGRREGIGLFDLIGFDRARLGRDLLLGLALPALVLTSGSRVCAARGDLTDLRMPGSPGGLSAP